MSYGVSARRGAVVGVGVGVALALLLLALGEFSAGEPMEGVVYLALPLSFPVGVVLAAAGLGGPATTWVPLIAAAIPLNAGVWGAAIAVARAAWPGRRPSRPAA